MKRWGPALLLALLLSAEVRIALLDRPLGASPRCLMGLREL